MALEHVKFIKVRFSERRLDAMLSGESAEQLVHVPYRPLSVCLHSEAEYFFFSYFALTRVYAVLSAIAGE